MKCGFVKCSTCVNCDTTEPTSVPTGVPTSVPTALPTNLPTSIPSSSPTKLPECKSWCFTNTNPWSMKCGWIKCSTCVNCDTSSPTSLPIPTPTNSPTNEPTSEPTSIPSSSPTLLPDCESWCFTNTQPWSLKCGFVKCSTCVNC